jgi:hypothetical protein
VKPDPRFLRLPKSFWANVRTISQQIRYTKRGAGQVKVPDVLEIERSLHDLGLSAGHLVQAGQPTKLGTLLLDYFRHRADVLNRLVEPSLMDLDQAKALFRQISGCHKHACPLPLNKQKGKKKSPAYFTCIINMLIAAAIKGRKCDYDPQQITTVTQNGMPLRTLARRIDGAFPSAVNPVAIWEIKEYYYTTTFGSRVADGVYESLLDGMELEELREHESIDVKHYLMLDAHYTWWRCGRSYLCRIVDMLHMGYVDEVLCGREVIARLPALAREWMGLAKARGGV